MARTEPRAADIAVHPALPSPDLSIVVTVLNEEGTLHDLYRRTVETLEATP